MSDSALGGRRLRHGLPAAGVIATAFLSVLAAGCGGSHSTAGSSNSRSTVGYSACMRSNGVPSFPDPDGSGDLPKGDAQHFGVGTSQYQAACQNRLPNYTASPTQCLMTGDCPAAVVQRALTEGRTFAQCMRNHGVPSWPDPTIDSTGRLSFRVTAAGISIASTRSPRMLAELGHCQGQRGAVLLRQE